MKRLVILGALMALTETATAQSLQFWQFSPQESGGDDIGAAVDGDINCASPTLLIDPVYTTQSLPRVKDNNATRQYSSQLYRTIITAALKDIVGRCPDAPTMRVIDHQSEARIHAYHALPRISIYTMKDFVAVLSNGRDVDEPHQVHLADLWNNDIDHPGQQPQDPDNYSLYFSHPLKSAYEKVLKQAGGPQPDATAWLANINAARGTIASVSSNIRAACDPSPFDRTTAAGALAALHLLQVCADRMPQVLVAPETIADPAVRDAYQSVFQPLIDAYSQPVQWLRQMPEEQVLKLQNYAEKRTVSNADVTEALVGQRVQGLLPDLYQQISVAWGKRMSELDAEMAQAKADEDARKEQMARERLQARIDGLANIKSIPGGPSALDILDAITAEHINRGYKADGRFAVRFSAPSLLGTATVDAFAVNVADLTCKATKAKEVFSCTYKYTHSNYTIEADESGIFSRGQTIIAMFSGGRDPYSYSRTMTDVFTRKNGQWRSPSWADWLADSLSRSSTAGAEREKCKKEYQFNDNKLVGHYASPSLNCG